MRKIDKTDETDDIDIARIFVFDGVKEIEILNMFYHESIKTHFDLSITYIFNGCNKTSYK